MTPFAVLHVCMGNICRSPMAERLLLALLRAEVADDVDALLYTHSAGTGGWHVGEPMHPPAARQVVTRGGDPDGFQARQLHGEHIDASDLILTATADQVEYVLALRPDAGPRTFVLGEFGRLLGRLDPAALPPFAPTPTAVYDRGSAIVAAADRERAGRSPEPDDDLDDPWGMSESTFGRTADEIEATLRPFVALLAVEPTARPR